MGKQKGMGVQLRYSWLGTHRITNQPSTYREVSVNYKFYFVPSLRHYVVVRDFRDDTDKRC